MGPNLKDFNVVFTMSYQNWWKMDRATVHDIFTGKVQSDHIARMVGMERFMKSEDKWGAPITRIAMLGKEVQVHMRNVDINELHILFADLDTIREKQDEMVYNQEFTEQLEQTLSEDDPV